MSLEIALMIEGQEGLTWDPLEAAQSHPRPARGTVRLIIGGRGERRTLRTVRDPTTIRRSLMIPIVIGESQRELDARRCRVLDVFPRVLAEPAEWRAAGFLYGSAADVRRDLAEWHRLGVSRVVLQMLDMTDWDAMEAIARDVVARL